MEMNETLFEAAQRELKEETNLDGEAIKILGSCSHYGSIFGDILLIGVLMDIKSWEGLLAMDDASEAELFAIRSLPDVAFHCHEEIIRFYIDHEDKNCNNN